MQSHGCGRHNHLPLPNIPVTLRVRPTTGRSPNHQRTAALDRPEEPASYRGFGEPQLALAAFEVKLLDLHTPCMPAVAQHARNLESAMKFDHVPAEVMHPPTRLPAVEYKRLWSTWYLSRMLPRPVNREGHRLYTRHPDCLKGLCYCRVA